MGAGKIGVERETATKRHGVDDAYSDMDHFADRVFGDAVSHAHNAPGEFGKGAWQRYLQPRDWLLAVVAAGRAGAPSP